MRRRRTLLPAAAAAAVFATALTGCGGDPGRGEKSAIIGLDGADWRNALPLIRQGKLPTLGALRRAGTSGVMLTNPDYRWSPVLWTSIATGRLPEGHGVTDFMADVDGFDRKIPTPSTERKCRAIWNLFSEQGRTVGFVGWWVTWPAEPVNGFMVTDHFSISRFDLGHDYGRDRGARFDLARTYPEELIEEVQDLKVDRQTIGRGDFSRFADLPADYEFPERFVKFDKSSEFAIAHSVDRTHYGAGTKLLAERDPALFGIFLQGIDIMQHYFWEFMDPEGTGTGPSDADRAAYGESIERYYRYADGMVKGLIEAGGQDRAYLLVSDHGFRPSQERWAEKNISGEHRRQAFFLMAGPGVKRGQVYDDFDAVDVTPTLLAYHGLPVAEDFDGEAAVDVFTAEWRADRPERTVATFETGPWERGVIPGDSELDHLTERIDALGYLGD